MPSHWVPTGCLPSQRSQEKVREEVGNSVFPPKVGEKSGILDKSQRKVWESF